MKISNIASLYKASFGSVEPNTYKTIGQMPNDSVEVTKTDKSKKPPKISGTRAFFNRLTDEQIRQVNETGLLPDNVKFRGSGVRPNWFNLTAGTQILPKDMEVKKSLLGFTKLVYKGTTGLFVRDLKKPVAEAK